MRSAREVWVVVCVVLPGMTGRSHSRQRAAVDDVLGSSDREAYRESLKLIRELDFDLLVPWAATAGGPSHAVTDHKDTERRIDALIERV